MYLYGASGCLPFPTTSQSFYTEYRSQPGQTERYTPSDQLGASHCSRTLRSLLCLAFFQDTKLPGGPSEPILEPRAQRNGNARGFVAAHTNSGDRAKSPKQTKPARRWLLRRFERYDVGFRQGCTSGPPSIYRGHYLPHIILELPLP